MRGYDESATARWVAEPPKRAGRSDFERDRARVLHCAGLRRLSAKTQVVAAGSADFPRTRLTHSLECAQIGRELGREIGCDPDLVDAACLAHDIGHSPFGHNGEAALNELAAPYGGFEGNAQSLRLLTRLEPKVAGAGLNLTRATLDATLKYPWFSAGPGGTTPPNPPRSWGEPSPPDPRGPRTPRAPQTPAAPRAPRKFGVYAEDAEVFDWIRAGAPAGRRCLEAQVMDWADDVAYSVHDLEDGFHAGLITFENLNSPAERTLVSRTTATTYCGADDSEAELTEVLDALLALDMWPDSYDGGPATVAALKNLTSELIGRFCVAAQEATLTAHLNPDLTSPTNPSHHPDLTNPVHPSVPHPLRRGPRRAAAAAAGVRPAQGDHGPLRDDPGGRDRRPGPGARTADRTGPRHRARRAAHARPAAAPGLGRGRNRRRAPPRGHRPGGFAHRHVGDRLASPPLCVCVQIRMRFRRDLPDLAGERARSRAPGTS